MKLLVIGDTHGKLNKLRDIWPKLTDIDLIAHTGDHFSDAIKAEEELGVPVIDEQTFLQMANETDEG